MQPPEVGPEHDAVRLRGDAVTDAGVGPALRGRGTDGRLRLGVIGAGAWAAAAHIPGFLRRPEVEPWIINRRDPVVLESLRERFGFAHATTDWREVIAARPDIVALAGPLSLRAEQAMAAIEAGIHVLAEKPFTRDPADAWAIDAAARGRGVHVVLCYAWNEMGISEHARRLIHGPDGIGRVEHVSVEMSTIVRNLLTVGTTYIGDPEVPLPRGETWSEPAVSGGGYGQGQLTHALGLVMRLLPDARAAGSRPRPGPVPGSTSTTRSSSGSRTARSGRSAVRRCRWGRSGTSTS